MVSPLAQRFDSYASFWPHYLREHRRATTRAFHFAGTIAGVACGIYALASQSWWVLAAALIAGYGPAWLAHAAIERNRPATFTHPWWSLVSDFRMLALWVSGRLAAELKKAGISV